MAFLAAAPMIEAGMAAAPEMLQAASMAAGLAQKYGPKVKGAVNHLFHMGRKKKSAASHLKRMGTRRGLSNFISKDLGRGIRGAGRAIKGAQNFATDVSHYTAEGTRGGSVGEHANKLAHVVRGAAAHSSRYHQLAEKYHDQGQHLRSPLKNYRF